MIKTLRKRIVLITLLSVGLVLAVIVIGMNVSNYAQIITKADNTLSYLAENKGRFPSMMLPNRQYRPEEQFQTRYFSVLFNANGSVNDIDVSSIFAVSNSQAVDYARSVLEAGKTSGFEMGYRYRVVDEGTGSRVIFIDITRDLDSFQTLLSNSLLISLAGFGAVIGLSLFFSRILLKPVEEAYIKQRQFITDASHELKTPITIINTNMEVLSMSYKQNKWIESTTRQADRMGTMVNDLLFLAKMDESRSLSSKESVDMKLLVETVIEDYQPLISENFDLRLHLADVLCIGDASLLKRLVNVVIENAVRYGEHGKQLEIQLFELREHHFKLQVTNSAVLFKTGNLDGVFDRFKRLDDSRNQKTGGSGIGLSIAKSIVDLHDGTIHALSDDGKHFTLTIEI